MATRVKAVVKFLTESALPKDVVINTFSFHQPVGEFIEDDFAEISSQLNSFYCTAPAVGSPLMSYMAGYLEDSVDPFVDFYDIEAPGDAIGQGQLISFNVDETLTSLPAEVAVCLSFHGSLEGILEDVEAGPPGPAGNSHPRARRRGRVFIGPLNTTALSGGAGNRSRVAPGLIETLQDRAANLRDELNSYGVEWVVYSTAGDTIHGVVGGWIDNEFDTQRRRGSEATTRSLW